MYNKFITYIIGGRASYLEAQANFDNPIEESSTDVMMFKNQIKVKMGSFLQYTIEYLESRGLLNMESIGKNVAIAEDEDELSGDMDEIEVNLIYIIIF